MISHKYQCIFIHIPKCAGTSIESVMGHLDDFDGRHGQDHRSIRVIQQPLFKSSSVSSMENISELLRRGKIHYINKEKNARNEYKLTEKQYRDYYKFTIVRNPWARAYSWYKNVMRDEIHLKKLNITNDTSFNVFLKKFAGKGLLKTQLYWIKDFEGNVPMDYIARFENLSEDISNIFRNLGLDNLSLPHKLKGAEDDYRNFYDEESIAIIEGVYGDEIALFGYSFA